MWFAALWDHKQYIVFFFLKIDFVLAKSADADENPPFVCLKPW